LSLGDFETSSIIYHKFTTFRPSTGAPFTLAGTPAISVYKDNSVTQSTTGVTLTVDFDSVTGLNHVAIDTSADTSFYSAGSFFDIVITTGTVDSVSAVGSVVERFTLRKNSARNIIRSGTAQAGGANSITLDAAASATNGLYDPSMLLIVAGTGAGQNRMIVSYDGTSKVAVVDRTWRTNPDSTSVFSIYPIDNGFSVNEGLAAGGGASTITLNSNAIATDNIYNGQLIQIRGGTGSDQVRMVLSYVGATKVATVTPAWTTTPDTTSVYEMMPAGYVQGVGASGIADTAFTAGALTAIGGAPWDIARAGHTTAGTFGAGVPTTYQIRKNVAINAFPLIMSDSTSHAPVTGKTVTATRSIDGAAFAACANSVTEVGNGDYVINLAAADLNGNTIVLRFTAAGCDDTLISLITQTA